MEQRIRNKGFKRNWAQEGLRQPEKLRTLMIKG